MDTITTPTAWTPDRVFTPSADEFGRKTWPVYLDRNMLHEFRSPYAQRIYSYFTAEFRASATSETRWHRDPLPPPPPDAAQRVMNGEPCPVCGSGNGTGTVRTLHRGNDTGIEVLMPVRCPCGAVVRFRDAWAKQMAAHKRFADVRLSSITPHPELALDLATQATIIAQVKAAPADSYFLTGQPNTGKSHIMSALFRHALHAWAFETWDRGIWRPAVWRIGAAQLLDEHVAWDTRNPERADVAPPTVTLRAIQACAEQLVRPRLFLDELDKIVPTDYKMNKLIAIVDAVYAANGQLVSTSNKGPRELVAKWGMDEAGTLIRRIGGGPGAHTINFQRGA